MWLATHRQYTEMHLNTSAIQHPQFLQPYVFSYYHVFPLQLALFSQFLSVPLNISSREKLWLVHHQRHIVF